MQNALDFINHGNSITWYGVRPYAAMNNNIVKKSTNSLTSANASGKTTEKYYVKYAAHENVAKMQIPLLQDIKLVSVTQVPTCLIQPKSSMSDTELHKRHGILLKIQTN